MTGATAVRFGVLGSGRVGQHHEEKHGGPSFTTEDLIFYGHWRGEVSEGLFQTQGRAMKIWTLVNKTTGCFVPAQDSVGGPFLAFTSEHDAMASCNHHNTYHNLLDEDFCQVDELTEESLHRHFLGHGSYVLDIGGEG